MVTGDTTEAVAAGAPGDDGWARAGVGESGADQLARSRPENLAW